MWKRKDFKKIMIKNNLYIIICRNIIISVETLSFCVLQNPITDSVRMAILISPPRILTGLVQVPILKVDKKVVLP